MSRFESYTLAVADDVGSFLTSRYERLDPTDVEVTYYGTTGSVLVTAKIN